MLRYPSLRDLALPVGISNIRDHHEVEGACLDSSRYTPSCTCDGVEVQSGLTESEIRGYKFPNSAISFMGWYQSCGLCSITPEMVSISLDNHVRRHRPKSRYVPMETLWKIVSSIVSYKNCLLIKRGNGPFLKSPCYGRWKPVRSHSGSLQMAQSNCSSGGFSLSEPPRNCRKKKIGREGWGGGAGNK
ncbi:unnamed protein product [Nezara viridula]|uniref:Uncharacterized protein n=1 Tax=Nezara viridula TaxID=85310 RepID=A0A9P0MWS0_NEZVI|nr:unnamed protein product [Nezara viridula]